MAQFSPGIIKAFTTLGLNQKHVEVLGRMYTLGRVRVHEISPDITNIRRTELYTLLNYLVKIQLVDKLSVNGVICYELKSNADITRWVNRKKLSAEEEYQQIVDAAGRIKNMLNEQERNVEPRPFFHYLEGAKGMETAHKIIMPNSDSMDIYMNYTALTEMCSDYERMVVHLLEEDPDVKIRIILTDEDLPKFPRKLQAEPRLFLRRSKKQRDGLLLCIGDKWVIDFTQSGLSFKGFYMHCQNFDCMDVFKDTFAKDWEASEELKSAPHLPSQELHYP